MPKIQMLAEKTSGVEVLYTREDFPCEKCGSAAKFHSKEGLQDTNCVITVIVCECGHTFQRTFMPARWIGEKSE